ncbi:MAG: tRNA (adenosine(37)-N6)-threonylcarbamoyltransferase complex dimerization subunit type 1 TsaB [Clostridia bacterium]|nr:tRNA (adenosine(37)-N6)-threonylcarbamoyltransferase complex dimerization subunit type 1 TsaB [Clostridia bacterium]
MKILSIDTASDLCTVAVLEDENCIKEIIVDDARNHSEKIMPVIEQSLSEANLTLKDINLLVCDKGPGSFTGIRIGVGTVLAFQDTLGIPCVGISSLEALAYNVKENGLICSLIDAKNNNVYFGLFRLENNEYKQLSDLNFKTIDETIQILKSYTSPITFVGDGAISYRNLLECNCKNYLFVDKNNLSSYSLGIAGLSKYKKGIETSLMPLYLRKSQAERALEEKTKKE